MKDLSHRWNRSFKGVRGVTGLREMPLSLSIIFFATLYRDRYSSRTSIFKDPRYEGFLYRHGPFSDIPST